MKNKKKRKRKFGKLKGHRNAGAIAPAAPRRRARLGRRGVAPDWRTTLAAVAGGAGGATLGGLAVNQQILSPEAVGIGMIGLGGATAYFADGNTRVLGNSVAAAGAGQLALALMAKRAFATERASVPPAAPAAPPQLASATPPPSSARRKSASGGGVVVDLFRDAARELDDLEDDDWQPPSRDAARPVEADVYELDLDDSD